MGGSIQQRSAAAWALAARQHWVIARRQLIALGFSPKAIEHRIATGRLYVIWRGVYAVGRRDLSPHGRWLAAVLACGPGTVLSHESAAQLWEIRPYRPQVVTDVSLAGGSARCLPGIEAHRRVAIRADEVTSRMGVPVTDPVCTLVDIACTLSVPALEAAVNEADKRDLVDPEALGAALDDRPRRPGIARLRRVLHEASLVLTESELERRFLPIAARAGLPRPLTQAHVHGFRLDFYWPEAGLVVETDGLRYHRTPVQQAHDRERDQTLTACGLTVLRFTHAQVRHEPRRVAALLASIYRRLLNRPRDRGADSAMAVVGSLAR